MQYFTSRDALMMMRTYIGIVLVLVVVAAIIIL